ncbi:MAG: mechanosensitive ion channel [Aliidiomarina sp.]|uniref:mechanosensitive ion channel domain-containing protein n=1 Tax=Aliidiomarina sp. TaxID=1872439 RepID=UPI0025B9085D|nr:mechanosensitive ion channel domain-containing protein [Aliidiomarina sp.]MCH8500484.1 mechanosensitive ion channel [Aliidiomarina sp.]
MQHTSRLRGLLLCFTVGLLAVFIFGVSTQRAAAQESTHESVALEQNLSAEIARLQYQLEEVRENRADLTAQYAVLSGSQLLHRVLQEQRAALPSVNRRDVNDQLAQLRLDLFYLQREIRTATAASQPLLVEQQHLLQQRIDQRVTYMRLQQELQLEVQAFALELEEFLFWTPSNPRLNADWFMNFPAQLQRQGQRMQQSVTTMLRHSEFRPTLTAIGLLILLLVLIWQHRRIQALLTDQQGLMNNSEQPPSPWLIARALAKVILYVAPLSLALLLVGQFIGSDETTEHLQPHKVFTALALALFMISFLRKVLKPAGFAEAFFQWPSANCAMLKRYIELFALALLPLTVILAFASQQTSLYAQDMVGSLSLVLAGLYLAGISTWLFSRLPTLYNSLFVHRLIAAAVIFLPLSLVWMVATGYYYTALRLSGYYLATFYVMTIWVILEASIRRAIQLSSETLKRERDAELALVTDEQSIADQDIENAAPVVTPVKDYADIEQAEAQSLRLGRFFLLVLFTFILFTVWSDALSALHYLDSQYIWDNEQGIQFIPVSIGALMTAFFIIVVSIVLIRNLPGLLEVMFLSRLKLEMGTSYAVTSLTNYVLISIAIVSVFAVLGVKWEQLQWLAAGLTVGLGFGLQEIFGNFISGLILFFERPVRVGDIVTLNNLSGRVSKIKIRATVITDFDRRDIVVPNRSFITGQFVNWSLSNTITRITVKVGVAYGSDLEKTRQILLEIADQEERVLKEPAPQVLFLSFGESTLDHELRMHVGGLSDRNPTIDAVNREIDKRFRAAGIEIAFNQIDVHFRNDLGVEKLIQQENRQSKDS